MVISSISEADEGFIRNVLLTEDELTGVQTPVSHIVMRNPIDGKDVKVNFRFFKRGAKTRIEETPIVDKGGLQKQSEVYPVVSIQPLGEELVRTRYYADQKRWGYADVKREPNWNIVEPIILLVSPRFAGMRRVTSASAIATAKEKFMRLVRMESMDKPGLPSVYGEAPLEDVIYEIPFPLPLEMRYKVAMAAHSYADYAMLRDWAYKKFDETSQARFIYNAEKVGDFTIGPMFPYTFKRREVEREDGIYEMQLDFSVITYLHIKDLIEYYTYSIKMGLSVTDMFSAESADVVTINPLQPSVVQKVSGGVTEEKDPIFTSSAASIITFADIERWNEGVSAVRQTVTNQSSVLVAHNLGIEPVVTFIDGSTGETVVGTVTHVSASLVRVDFSSPQTGIIICTR